jgi:DNA-binding NtrC family response regulator
LEKIAAREKKQRLKLPPETLKVFLSYDWPATSANCKTPWKPRPSSPKKERSPFPPSTSNRLVAKAALHTSPQPLDLGLGTLDSIDPELLRILKAIRDAGYHRSKAAEALGMSRRNLYARLEKLGVKRDAATLHAYIARYLA